ncbi:antichymotrypsin-2-like [Diabrotica undecimpunctata]|uniref:antichymotrypsin-2-like n=1 Tax=Diabrotica undecimpunctata TaxID=50387 RepID=UPI003B63BEF7
MHAVVILIITSFFGCNADNIKSVVRGNVEFTANTFQELIKISGNNNIIVSGLSAEIVLALLANGAKGETQKQLLNGLSLPNNIEDVNKAFTEMTYHLNSDTPDLKVLSANKIYPSKDFPIKQSFKDIGANIYSADVENLDFNQREKAASTINDWVAQKTNNKIQKLIDSKSLKVNTELILVNALYYAGKFKHAFEKLETANRLFHSSPTESKKIPTMKTLAFTKYAYNDKLKAKFLELEFKGGNSSITFVLPDEINGLADAEHNLKEYLAPQKMKYANVAINLPKFKIETEINFNPILHSFGITRIFKHGADLSGIADGPLKVDSVKQKAYVKLDEDGVEAAAATAIGVMRPLLEVPEEIFNANHPFIFYILHNNLLLFMGRFIQEV